MVRDWRSRAGMGARSTNSARTTRRPSCAATSPDSWAPRRRADDRMNGADASRYETGLDEVGHHVATVTLNRPEVHNALDLQLRTDLVAALRAAESNENVAVILLKGAGRSFCAVSDWKTPGHGAPSRGRTGWVADPNLETWTDQFARSCVRDW